MGAPLFSLQVDYKETEKYMWKVVFDVAYSYIVKLVILSIFTGLIISKLCELRGIDHKRHID